MNNFEQNVPEKNEANQIQDKLLKFLLEKKMILLLIYCKEYAKIHDRTQKDKAMGAAFKFWRDT